MGRVTVDAAAIDRQCSQILGRGFQLEVGTEMKDLMDEFVPHRDGTLRGDAVPGTMSVTYGGGAEPYARYQHELRTSNRTTAGTGDHWEDMAFPEKDGELGKRLTAWIKGH